MENWLKWNVCKCEVWVLLVMKNTRIVIEIVIVMMIWGSGKNFISSSNENNRENVSFVGFNCWENVFARDWLKDKVNGILCELLRTDVWLD